MNRARGRVRQRLHKFNFLPKMIHNSVVSTCTHSPKGAFPTAYEKGNFSTWVADASNMYQKMCSLTLCRRRLGNGVRLQF